MGIIVLKEISTICKPICEYCKGHKKIPTTIKQLIFMYCNLNLSIMQISALWCEYCNGCKKNQQNYLRNLYVEIVDLKWPYGS